MATKYIIKSLDDLNTLDRTTFSGLESIAFDLPYDGLNQAAKENLYKIKQDQKNKSYTYSDNYYTLFTTLGFVLPIIFIGAIGMFPPALLISPFLGSLGYHLGSYVDDEKTKKEAYKEFSKLRERINKACKNLKDGPYRSCPVLLKEEKNDKIYS